MLLSCIICWIHFETLLVRFRGIRCMVWEPFSTNSGVTFDIFGTYLSSLLGNVSVVHFFFPACIRSSLHPLIQASCHPFFPPSCVEYILAWRPAQSDKNNQSLVPNPLPNWSTSKLSPNSSRLNHIKFSERFSQSLKRLQKNFMWFGRLLLFSSFSLHVHRPHKVFRGGPHKVFFRLAPAVLSLAVNGQR